jgi:hypothetical protein
LGLLKHAPKTIDKIMPVLVIFENLITLYAAHNDVMQRGRRIDACLAGHGLTAIK